MILRSPESQEWREYRDFLLSKLPPCEARAFGAWFKTFYPFQQQWLLEPSDQAICNKSRQTGFSHTTGGLATMWGVAFGETTTLISVGEREAKEVLEKSKTHAALLRDFGSRWAGISGRDSAEEIKFKSGGRVIALPQTSAGRSFSGNVFLDEFAYLERPEKVWDGAAAVTMHGYRLRVASTPNGTGNAFHELWERPEQNDGWAGHMLPIQRAINDGMRVDMAKCWTLAKGDPRIFDQLFNCKFIDGAMQYIPSEAIAACSEDDLSSGGPTYGGLDIGRTADLTALVLVRRGADKIIRLRIVKTCKRTDQAALDALVSYALVTCGARRLCVDSSGLGAFPAEAMQRQYGVSRVEPVVFKPSVKEDLATSLYTHFTDNTVRIARTDKAIPGSDPGSAEALRNELCSIRREVTSAGNVRYDAPHTDAGHADRAWALALALHACSSPVSTLVMGQTNIGLM